MPSFKKCPKGHIYRNTFARCPYCDGSVSGFSSENSTQLLRDNATQLIQESSQVTQLVEEEPFASITSPPLQKDTNHDTNHTILISSTEKKDAGKGAVTEEFGKAGKKFVGWLVSYSLNPLGVDFKLYEGKNFIGKDSDCTVSVPDNGVSGKHATLLYRAGKFRLRDNLSSNGTFVNGRDIEDETCTLHDGDQIFIGNTVFVFKSALPANTDESSTEGNNM